MKYKVAVSGSAMNNCGPGAFKKAWEVGYEIAKQGAVLITGATVGIPEWSTRGAKAAKGVSIGFSPASSYREHVKKYHLPTSNMDVIVYTGFDYTGRDLLLIRASDAVIEICGRIGTLNEFSVAFEDKKPIGILLGTGGAVEEIPRILKIAKRGDKNIIYDTDPKKLVKRLLALTKRNNVKVDRFQRNLKAKKKKVNTPE